MNTLYHYVHCPFCVRVRMALGLFNIDWKSKVLPYDDEKTPVGLCDKKMLPIYTFSDGTSSNESLDIIERLDEANILKTKEKKSDQQAYEEVENLLNEIGKYVHNLAMPYWIYTPEFNSQSRMYFVNKKSVKRGPFHLLAQKRAEFEGPLLEVLSKLENDLTPFYKSEELSIYDIMIASHIWGVYVVPELYIPSKIHQYLQSIKEKCSFNYHEDFWQEEIKS